MVTPRDTSTHGKIVCTPGVLGGAPRIDGTRIGVGAVVGLLLAGVSADGILADYPSLVPEDITAAAVYELRAVRVERERMHRVHDVFIEFAEAMGLGDVLKKRGSG